MHKQGQISEDKITKAKQQNEIQLTRDFKEQVVFFFFFYHYSSKRTTPGAALQWRRQSMDRSWLDSQGVSYIFLPFFFFLYIIIAIDVNDRRGTSSQKLEQRMNQKISVLVSKSVGPEEYQRRVIAPGNYLSPSHNLAQHLGCYRPEGRTQKPGKVQSQFLPLKGKKRRSQDLQIVQFNFNSRKNTGTNNQTFVSVQNKTKR